MVHQFCEDCQCHMSRVYMRSAYQKSETYWLLGPLPFPWGGGCRPTAGSDHRAGPPRSTCSSAAQHVQNIFRNILPVLKLLQRGR